jgi:hypothetical protein
VGGTEAGFCQQQVVLVYEMLDGPYGGRAERRMKISLRNGIVASFCFFGLCLRYLKEYRVEGVMEGGRFSDGEGNL